MGDHVGAVRQVHPWDVTQRIDYVRDLLTLCCRPIIYNAVKLFLAVTGAWACPASEPVHVQVDLPGAIFLHTYTCICVHLL